MIRGPRALISFALFMINDHVLRHIQAASLVARYKYKLSPVPVYLGHREETHEILQASFMHGVAASRFKFNSNSIQNFVQAYPYRCHLGCVCFVLLIVSPHSEHNKHNLGDNGMDTPVFSNLPATARARSPPPPSPLSLARRCGRSCLPERAREREGGRRGGAAPLPPLFLSHAQRFQVKRPRLGLG